MNRHKAALKAAIAGGTTVAAKKVDVKKLKEMTRAAIEKGQEEARKLAEHQSNQERLRKLAEERKAQNIIDQIPGRAEREATAGRNHAIVMAVKYEDYVRPQHTPEGKDWRICKGEWLRGVAKLVFDYCVEAELNPTLEDWHDGVGMNSGHNIVIHW